MTACWSWSRCIISRLTLTRSRSQVAGRRSARQRCPCRHVLSRLSCPTHSHGTSKKACLISKKCGTCVLPVLVTAAQWLRLALPPYCAPLGSIWHPLAGAGGQAPAQKANSLLIVPRSSACEEAESREFSCKSIARRQP